MGSRLAVDLNRSLMLRCEFDSEAGGLHLGAECAGGVREVLKFTKFSRGDRGELGLLRLQGGDFGVESGRFGDLLAESGDRGGEFPEFYE